MKMSGIIGGFAVVALAGAAAAQPAYSQLKFDINAMKINFTSGANGSGSSIPTVSAGGGLGFTGSWEMTFGAGAYLINDDVLGNNLSNGAGPFNFAGKATLTSVSGFLNFNAGSLTGGSFAFGVNNGDTIQGSFANSGSSNISGAGGGPWFVTGLAINSTFTSANSTFGTSVDISKFVNKIFGGSFSEIFLSDDGSNGDFDLIIEAPPVAPGIPAPMAASMGALGLLTLSARRRRTV